MKIKLTKKDWKRFGIFAGGIVAVGVLIAGAVTNWFGAVKPTVENTKITASVKFGAIQAGTADSKGIVMLTDDKGTEATSDDTCYKIVRYATTGQADGLAILDQDGTILAVGKADLTKTVKLEVKSQFNNNTQIRTTSVYVDGKLVEISAPTNGTDGVKVSSNKSLVDTRTTVSGSGAGSAIVTDFDGDIYL